MNFKSLINQIELAYAPLTAYEFAVMRNDPDLERALWNSSLYIIAQRPVMTFENIYPDLGHFQISFEIHQKNNPNVLTCKLPLDQPKIGLINQDMVDIAVNFLNGKNKKDQSLTNIHGFSLLKRNKEEKEFTIWFSPEKLLQNWWIDGIECQINGNWRSFLNYQVHYVGKATKQNILQRLTGHTTLQDILSLQSPVTEKQLPSNEIVILPFEFQENIELQTFGQEDNIKSMSDAIYGKNYPVQERIFLDAEKALIKAMQPRYNKVLFKNYPISKDGLHELGYNNISYSFIDPINLMYQENQIRGGLSHMGGDLILIKNSEEFRISKYDE